MADRSTTTQTSGSSSEDASKSSVNRSIGLNHFNVKYNNIPKLKGTDNYQQWRDTAEYLLTALGIWDAMMGTDPLEPIKGNQEYADRKRECSLFLFQTVEPKWLPILTANREPSKIWKALESKFGIENPRTFFFQYKTLIQLKLEDRSRISQHLTQFETEWARFQHRCAQGKESDKLKLPYQLKEFAQSEQAKATVLLASLPAEMDNIVDNLLTKDLSYDDVLSRLMDLAQKDSQDDGDDKAYLSKQRQKQKSTQPSRAKDSEGDEKVCTYCRKHYPNSRYTGHTWNVCFKLKADNRTSTLQNDLPALTPRPSNRSA
jgi:hypothetical protein